MVAKKVWLSVVEYAASRDVDKSRIVRLRQSGRLDGALRMKGKRYEIHGPRADALLAASMDPAQPARKLGGAAEPDEAPSGGGLSYAEGRRLEMVARARLRQLEAKEKNGELIKAADVRRDMFALARLTRDRLLSLPDQLGPILAAETDPLKCVEILARGITEALESLVAE